MKRTPIVAIIVGLTIASILSACAASTPPAQVSDPSECSQLVLSGDMVPVLLGGKEGIRTQSTELYLRNPGEAPQGIGMNVEIELVNGSEVLSARTQAIFGKPSGVEIAILPDMDADLLAAAPDNDSSDSNKIYYFADVIRSILDQLSINDNGSLTNFALIAIPSHSPQRFISDNAAFNFLMKSLADMAAMDRNDILSTVRDNLSEWVKTPGKLPRLILVIRLRESEARLKEYATLIGASGSLAPPPLVVVDVGQGGNSQSEGNITIVPLGLPPWHFNSPGWPPPAYWQHLLPGMRTVLTDTLPAKISGISQVFEIPDLSWPVLLTQEQFKNTVLRVKWHSSYDGVLSCSRKLMLLTPLPEQNTTPYSLWIGLSVVITSAISLGVLFFPQLKNIIRHKITGRS